MSGDRAKTQSGGTPAGFALIGYYQDKEAPAYAYMVRCSDNSLYAGWTNDIQRRLKAHNEGHGAKYTRGRVPVVLEYMQSFATQGQAMAHEAWLKSLPKSAKEKLCAEWKSGKSETFGALSTKCT